MAVSKANRLRVNALALTLCAAAAAVLASTVPAQEKPITPENYFPDGPGRDLIFQSCVQCHDLRNTVSQRKTATAWKRTVDEMVWRGAPLMADEAQTITNYLAASFGPDNPIPLELKTKPTDKQR